MLIFFDEDQTTCILPTSKVKRIFGTNQSDAEFGLELDIMRKNVNKIYDDNDDDKENDVNVENISPLKKRKVDNSQLKEIKNISPRKLQTSNNNKRSATKQKPKEKKKDLKAKKVNIVIIWLVYCGAFGSIEVKAPPMHRVAYI